MNKQEDFQNRALALLLNKQGMEYRSLVTFGGLEESYYTRYCIDGLPTVRILWQVAGILQLSAI